MHFVYKFRRAFRRDAGEQNLQKGARGGNLAFNGIQSSVCHSPPPFPDALYSGGPFFIVCDWWVLAHLGDGIPYVDTLGGTPYSSGAALALSVSEDAFRF